MSPPAREASVAVFRETLLPYSETFIAQHVAALERYAPTLVGLERLPGVALPAPALVMGDERGARRVDAAWLKVARRVPRAWLAALRARRFDLLHAHFGPDGLWAVPIARALRVPLVVTFHGHDVNATQLPLSRAYRYYRWRRGDVFHAASRVVAVSAHVRSRLVALGCPAERVVTLHLGVDARRFAPRPLAREEIVLYVGRLIEQKGALDLLRAFAVVKRARPDARLVVIGAGPLEARVRADAARLGVPCELLGARPPEEVRAWMNRAALLCVPARHEAFGLVYAEAQAMELPVVAYDHAGVPEAVRHGVGGLLGPPGDVPRLARDVLALLDDPERRDRFGAAGRADVVSRLDHARQTRRLEALYDEVLGRARGAA